MTLFTLLCIAVAAFVLAVICEVLNRPGLATIAAGCCFVCIVVFGAVLLIGGAR